MNLKNKKEIEAQSRHIKERKMKINMRFKCEKRLKSEWKTRFLHKFVEKNNRRAK